MKRAQFVAEQNAKLQQRVKELEKWEAQIDLEQKSLLIEREKVTWNFVNDPLCMNVAIYRLFPFAVSDKRSW